jgi:hypothetical protein
MRKTRIYSTWLLSLPHRINISWATKSWRPIFTKPKLPKAARRRSRISTPSALDDIPPAWQLKEVMQGYV